MELIVKLKQHTPIIHFQWDQKGATLRATELKPKLDRYIKKKYYGNDQNIRLKYQVKIKYLSTPTKSEISRDSMCFSYMGRHSPEPKPEIYGSELELRFNTYFDAELKKQIEETLPICLALENFGTRNNKGNGCFFIKDKSIGDFESVLKANAPSPVYYWDCNSSDAMFSIKIVYSLLKSGINIELNSTCKTYYKSLLHDYFCDSSRNISWDKKAIKSYYLPSATSTSCNYTDKKFVRGLLGVSETQDWRHYRTKLTIKSNDFERVPSPIVFKIFDKGSNAARIYFFYRDSYNGVLNRDFVFSASPYFHADDFKPPLTIEGLCKAIEKDNYGISLGSRGKPIHWLNELLTIPDFYDKWAIKKVKLEDIDREELKNETNSYRNKKFLDLNEIQRDTIKRLNRLLLEKTYPTLIPKSQFIPISKPLILSVPGTFNFDDYLKDAVNKINSLKINNKGSRTFGLVQRIDTMLSKISTNKIKELK